MAQTHDIPTSDLLTRMVSLGAHLMPLIARAKRPLERGWPVAVAMSVDEALAHLNAGGNIGVNLALSRLICLDSEDLAATGAVASAGLTPTVIPARSQLTAAEAAATDSTGKIGGSHVWLRVPDGIDAHALPTTAIGIRLPGGGVIDVLAGSRYAVAPPSRIVEAPGYAYAACARGPLDLSLDSPPDIPVAPAWLFEKGENR